MPPDDDLERATGPDGDPAIDPDVDPAIPVALAATRPKREPVEELSPHSFERLKGEQVVVRASGFEYRGELVGADESELYLRSETRWVVLPLDRVTGVRRATRPLVPPASPPGFPSASDASDER